MTTETDSMRAKIAGLPVGVRMMLGLATVVLFLVFGLAMLEDNRAIAWGSLALATLRMVLLMRSFGRVMTRRSEEAEDRGAPPEPAPWPEDEDEDNHDNLG
jgi:hypothetical protein